MPWIREMPTSRCIDYKWSMLTDEFECWSDIVGRIIIPVRFTCDWESVPIFKGTSKVAGLIHDYLSRYDSQPVVTKKVAADVYLEFMKYRGAPAWRRWLKYSVVLMWPGYFHRKSVYWQKPETQMVM